MQLGWVQHSITGYRLGWRANRLPSRANEESQLRAVAAPHIQILAATTGLIVHLAVLDGAAVRYLDKIGSGASVVPSRVGGSLPAHLTAVGKATLAYVDPEFLDALLGRLRSRVDSVAVHRELATVRMRGGLSSVRNGPLGGESCIGAPIFDGGNRITGGLSLCDAENVAPLDRYAPLLIERARRISADLAELQQRPTEFSVAPAEQPSLFSNAWGTISPTPFPAARLAGNPAGPAWWRGRSASLAVPSW